MRTVLIFAHECAPFHRVESTIGAQRPAQFAKHLPKYGWRAIVLCRDASAEASVERVGNVPVQSLVQTALAAAKPDQSVIIPLPSLKSDGVLDGFWRWTNTSARSRNVFWRGLRKVATVAKFLTGDYSQNWQPLAKAAAGEVLRRVHIDGCIGEHSPDAGIFLARWFSRQFDIPWLADFRDPALLQHPRWARRIRRPILRMQLRSAAALINVNPGWVRRDEREYRRPGLCVPNGYDPEEFEIAIPAGKSDGLTIVYTGNINAGTADPHRGLKIFLDGLGLAVRAKPGQDLRFQYWGNGGQSVLAAAAAAGVLPWVDVRQWVPRVDALKAMMQGDLLLLITVGSPSEEDEYYREGFYPGKVFEYFGAGKPILCVPGDRGQLDALIRETKAGVILPTAQSISQYLLDALSRRERGEIPGGPTANGQMKMYTRSALTGKLAERLDELVSQNPRKIDDGHIA